MKSASKSALPLKLLLAATLAALSMAAQAEFVVGIAAPISGAPAPAHTMIGRSIRNGAVLALELAEDSGKFGEVRLSIRSIDDGGTPKEAAERIVKFVRDELAILVIGPTLSKPAEAAADLANHNKFPLLAPGTSEGINATGKWAFRLSMSPYKTIQALAARALAETPRARVALVHAKGNAGFASQAAEFRAAAQRSGAVVAAEIGVAIDTDFIAAAAASIRESGATVVFFSMDAEPGAALARAVVEGAVNGVEGAANNAGSATTSAALDTTTRPKFVFAPAAAQPALTRIGGAALEGALTAADYLPELPGAANEQFRNAYRNRFGIDADSWAGTGFAAGQMAAEAIRNAGPAPTGETVRLALERVNDVALLVGAGNWKQDAFRNPEYAPRLFVVREGRLTAEGSTTAKP